jgi:uncharacterized protein YbjT (DUF2867 family)
LSQCSNKTSFSGEGQAKEQDMILVTGASGLNGSVLVRKLSARGIAVRALVRTAARAGDLAALPHVEIAEADMARPQTLAAPLHGIERAMLISSADRGMVEVQTNFIEAAKKAGVRHVVKLSGIFPELDSPFRFARMHTEVEQRLAASGLAYTNLRAGEFMHSYFRQVPSIVSKSALFLPMADARIASIDVDDIAEVAADVLTGPGHEGRNYPLTGPEALSMTEVAKKLSKVAGKLIRYVDVPPEDAKRAQITAGMPEFLAEGIAELFAERRKGKEGNVSAVIPKTFGRKPISFDQFAARYAAVFRGEQPPPR